MKKITVFDTSVATSNLGDEIIVDGVNKQLNKIFRRDMFLKVPTHEYLNRQSHRIIKQSSYKFVAGTNLLNSNYHFVRSNSWKLKLTDAFRLNDLVLLGVGWGAYQKEVGLLNKSMYKNILSTNYIHSVRDNYTKEKLNSIGIDNVLNTGCATMWDLTPDFCSKIPAKKARNVVFTLTDYSQDVEKDQQLIDILKREYENVYFWVQGSKDYSYLKSLDFSDVDIVPPKLVAYDELLESDIDLEFIGTRLHGGIRAMQKGRRTIIIGVDNRALEKQKDFNLNVIDRNDIDKLSDYINSEIETDLTLDFEAINKWKNQFLA